MEKLNIIKEICNYFDYYYTIYEDGRVVIDNGLDIEHESTLEWLNYSYCGHLEYKSIDDMLFDWLDELTNGEVTQIVFKDEIEFIKQLKNNISINKRRNDDMAIKTYFDEKTDEMKIYWYEKCENLIEQCKDLRIESGKLCEEVTEFIPDKNESDWERCFKLKSAIEKISFANGIEYTLKELGFYPKATKIE